MRRKELEDRVRHLEQQQASVMAAATLANEMVEAQEEVNRSVLRSFMDMQSDASRLIDATAGAIEAQMEAIQVVARGVGEVAVRSGLAEVKVAMDRGLAIVAAKYEVLVEAAQLLREAGTNDGEAGG